MVETIIVRRKDFDDPAFVDKLRVFTHTYAVAVIVDARVRGRIPEMSKYGQCLLRGSLTRMNADEAAYLRRPASILRRTLHLWYMRGILIK